MLTRFSADWSLQNSTSASFLVKWGVGSIHLCSFTFPRPYVGYGGGENSKWPRRDRQANVNPQLSTPLLLLQMLFQTRGDFLPVMCWGPIPGPTSADGLQLSPALHQWQPRGKSEILRGGAIYRTELAGPANQDFWFSGEPIVKHWPALNSFQLSTKVQHVFMASQQVSGLIMQCVTVSYLCSEEFMVFGESTYARQLTHCWGLPRQRTWRNNREIRP